MSRTQLTRLLIGMTFGKERRLTLKQITVYILCTRYIIILITRNVNNFMTTNSFS